MDKQREELPQAHPLLPPLGQGPHLGVRVEERRPRTAEQLRALPGRPRGGRRRPPGRSATAGRPARRGRCPTRGRHAAGPPAHADRRGRRSARRPAPAPASRPPTGRPVRPGAAAVARHRSAPQSPSGSLDRLIGPIRSASGPPNPPGPRPMDRCQAAPELLLPGVVESARSIHSSARKPRRRRAPRRAQRAWLGQPPEARRLGRVLAGDG